MNIACQMDKDNKYTPHYEVLDRITKEDKTSAASLILCAMENCCVLCIWLLIHLFWLFESITYFFRFM